jgi:hypothetical protein
MTVNETAFLLRKLTYSKHYYEYGCGGSTLLACIAGPTDLKIHSIDSSKEWVNKMLSNKCIKDSHDSGRLSIQFCNLGAVGIYGIPIDFNETAKNTWHTYSESIYFVKEKVDLVLVDGRFRLACMLQAMINMPDAVILFHDFMERTHHNLYTAILDVVDIIENVETFVSIRKKANIKVEELKIMYDKFKMIVH